jgi:hypothetical protein
MFVYAVLYACNIKEILKITDLITYLFFLRGFVHYFSQYNKMLWHIFIILPYWFAAGNIQLKDR